MRIRKNTGQLGAKTGPLSGRRKRRTRIRWKRLLFSVILFLGLTTTSIYAALYHLLTTLSANEAVATAPGDWRNGLTLLREHRNILVMGTDYSYQDGKRDSNLPVRSDSLLVIALSPLRRDVTILSIPRDTGAYINGRFDKINAALSLGGPKLASQVTEDLLGVPIERWMTVNTTGLEKVVDALGGVPITVDHPMRYADRTAKLDINIPQGHQVLTGKAAHQYVRFRHDALGDIGRVQRQQKFLQALTGVLLSPATVLKMPQVINGATESISTNMSGSELMQVVTHCVKLKRDQVHMVMLPGHFSQGEYSTSYWLVSNEAAYALGQRFLSDRAAGGPMPDRSQVKLTVLNGTRHPSLASNTARRLREAGWNVHAFGDAPTPNRGTTQIIVQTGLTEFVAALQSDLNVKTDCIHASVGDLATDFTIILNDDVAKQKE